MCVPALVLCWLRIPIAITVGQQPFPQTKVVDLFKVVLAAIKVNALKRDPPYKDLGFSLASNLTYSGVQGSRILR